MEAKHDVDKKARKERRAESVNKCLGIEKIPRNSLLIPDKDGVSEEGQYRTEVLPGHGFAMHTYGAHSLVLWISSRL